MPSMHCQLSMLGGGVNGSPNPLLTPRRSFMRRRATALLAAIAAGLALIAASTTVAGPATAKPGLDTSAQYEVHDARTLAKRNLVAGTGAAIEGIDHGVVTVSATKT